MTLNCRQLVDSSSWKLGMANCVRQTAPRQKNSPHHPVYPLSRTRVNRSIASWKNKEIDMKFKQAMLLLATVLTLSAAGYGTWKIVAFFVQKLTSINPAVTASIIGAMATVSAGVAAVIITQKQTKAREIAEAHREKKVEMYDKFLVTITRVIKNLNENETVQSEGISETELISSMFEFKRQIILWGSPKVIKAQLEFEAVAARGDNVFLSVDNLYRAIREDIGLSNSGLAQFDIFKLFLKDADQMDIYLKAGTTPPSLDASAPN